MNQPQRRNAQPMKIVVRNALLGVLKHRFLRFNGVWWQWRYGGG